ncbi:MAG: anaerobic ribonucleoside-triphosphate reductase activating protein [Lachnospiraceae bacterium]|nr:anaerobic ribonucleoside-triphosphate reductase activating protein [Lachnospiraceae bacterium]MDD3795343.1 anaerobic ribonucleoside-triphosphate reductase activating protein [Lachnospiraceae bacterium]
MRYHNITKDDMLNGDGLRVVLWVAGCSHCCKECQNPVTWDPNGGIVFDQKAKDELFRELEKSYITGITFSGGDPMHLANEPGVTELAKEIRQAFPEKTIWLYTGGLWESMKNREITKYLDVVVDGEYERDKRSTQLHWKGSSNQRVIDVPASLRENRVILHE